MSPPLLLFALSMACREPGTWVQYVDEIEAQVAATGLCPSRPHDLVPDNKGRLVPSDPVWVKTSEAFAVGSYRIDPAYNAADTDSTSVFLEVGGLYKEDSDYFSDYYGEPKKECLFRSEAADPDSIGSRLGLHFSQTVQAMTHPPVVYSSREIWANNDAWFKVTRGTETAWAEPNGARFWLCLEEVIGPEGFDYEDSPAMWRGSAYMRVGEWSTTEWGPVHEDGTGCGAEPLPREFFVTIDGIGCAVGEDASAYYYPEYCVDWGPACDGIDNDLDGVIDESRWPELTDLDGNGVTDCMDDDDGDGTVNRDDPDIDECCCY